MYILKAIKEVKQHIDSHVVDFKIEGAVTKEPVNFEDRIDLSYKSYNIGDSWGELFDCAWFKLTAQVKDSDKYYIKFDMNCEALLYDEKGNPVKGFTNGSSNFGFMGHLGSPGKKYYPLTDFTDAEGNISLWIDAGMNDLFGNVKKKGRIQDVKVVTRDLDARQLYYDLKSLVPMYFISLKEDKEAARILGKSLRKISKLVFLKKGDWIQEALAICERLYKLETKHDHHVSSIGHAHLDLAWLWPIRETKRKGARTIANVLRLMETHEDFMFGASQPQLYQWIKDEYPDLYEQIKVRIKEGRWEVQGGMWVEADTNVSGEEALVRQMLYGTKFYKDEFGIAVNSLWLPDVFGYSGNMPQIIKKSGMDNFMTIKISWNDTNKFPHHTFNWKGIDDTEVFAHMPPEGEYNSPANAYFLRKSMKKYREKDIDNQTLNLFGVGDGGGGPAPSHVERIRRYNGRPTMPKIKMEPSYKFFEKLSQIKNKFPVYSGELYLEKHRGTYTSQGRVKYFNRKMEQKLKTLELLLVQLHAHKTYKDELEIIWKEVLLYQFHDILPGSSIKRVYDECIVRYEMLDKRLDEIIGEVLKSEVVDDLTDSMNDLNIYNPLLKETTTSVTSSNAYHLMTVAPMSNHIIKKLSWEKEKGTDTQVLENAVIKVSFKRDGSISSVYDKKLKMQVLRNVGNQLKVYKDIANAWDIFKHYKMLPSKAMKLEKTEAYHYGPVQQIVQHYTYGKSTLKQIITLKPDTRMIEFDLDVDWQNNKRMLRTAFPLNLKTDDAIFDIQFGHIKRSTKNNTKVLRAQYEASGHNWVDMSNDQWGAALITDSKYGFKAKHNTLDLHLIKSTNYPAKSGDIGRHSIKYALYIHEGDHLDGCVDEIAMAYNTYMPITTTQQKIEQPLFNITGNNVTYSTVKEAEEGDGIIIRLYERHGTGDTVTLEMKEAVGAIYTTNMVEEEALLLTNDKKLSLTFTSFEVKTLKVQFIATKGE